MLSLLFNLQGISVAMLFSTAALLPTSRIAVDKWAETLFPDPVNCSFGEGGLSYNADDKEMLINNLALPDATRQSLKAMESRISATCTSNEGPPVVVNTVGEYFGSRFNQFTLPIYALKAGGGCMSDFHYSFTFPEKAKTVHDNILQRTGKNLEVISESGRSVDLEDDGWITDYGTYSKYTCRMRDYL
ncbi:hypothetical protein FHX08_000957 [Rhizobium sp. BK529]|uniref:hypothetical protein n=1 Tax=unclassified Rhizobium TaxID=2613769 RepID=UPI0010436E05|nr:MULTISPECIES: hypothetical protein [unclassified Rhizobium]MBB3590613.1 hypothetical protein [Rhizobium sp. BK529]TCS05306.1 hypothetical protein EV281_103988 [Rhizobium sp. BK418]